MKKTTYGFDSEKDPFHKMGFIYCGWQVDRGQIILEDLVSNFVKPKFIKVVRPVQIKPSQNRTPPSDQKECEVCAILVGEEKWYIVSTSIENVLNYLR